MVGNKTQVPIQIKGVREGLLATLGEGEWPELKATLLAHIEEKRSFFQGARLALDVGNQILHAAEMGALRDKLSDQGVSLWAVLSNSPTTESTAQILGLATRLSAPRSDRTIRPLSTAMSGENAMLVQKTLRSGVKIESEGHVIVIGDVNPGAEIVAGGSVLVWGKLRGSVHAGAGGDERVVICALEMQPTRMRIASNTAVPNRPKSKPQAETARVVDGQVVIDEWKYK